MNVRAWGFCVLPAYKMVKAKIKQVESSHPQTLKQSFYNYTSLFKVEWHMHIISLSGLKINNLLNILKDQMKFLDAYNSSAIWKINRIIYHSIIA